jgi:predicted transposase YbfD/YdcC
VLALKGNQPELHASVRYLVADGLERDFAAETVTHDHTVEGTHGRVERREGWTAADPALIPSLDPQGRGPGLPSVVMGQTQRTTGDATQSETRSFLSSLPADAKRLNGIVRAHWQIEHQLHWVLDVSFDEDQSRIRSGYADQNFAALRRFAISLLTKDKSRKIGKHAKRLRAGWDNDYLLHLLTQYDAIALWRPCTRIYTA